jgi:hypothetical protein
MLSLEFEYANTTKEIDYNFYMQYAGLRLTDSQAAVRSVLHWPAGIFLPQATR